MLAVLSMLVGSAFADDDLAIVQQATLTRSPVLEVRSGGAILREGKPGAVFTLVQPEKAKRRFAFCLLIKHRLGEEGANECNDEATVEKGVATIKQTVQIAGRSVQLDYKIELDPKSDRETLTINKKSVDLSRGRVFLVDLTGKEPRWEQRKITLPDDPSEASSKKETEELAEKVLSGAKTDRKIKEFLETR
jgi:hypothetical protein